MADVKPEMLLPMVFQFMERAGMAKAAKAFAKESGQSSSELNKSSDDIVEYMLDTYGPSREAYDPKALWPLRGGFLLATATVCQSEAGT